MTVRRETVHETEGFPEQVKWSSKQAGLGRGCEPQARLTGRGGSCPAEAGKFHAPENLERS